MLTSVKIHKYRSCSEVSLNDLSSLLVLIGRNGAGKTNILKAIEWGARLASGEERVKERSVAWSPSDGKITFEFSLENFMYRYFVEARSFYEIEGGRAKEVNVFIETLCVHDSGKWYEVVSRNNEKITLSKYFGDQSEAVLSVSDTIPVFAALQSLLSENNKFREVARIISKFFASVRYYPLQNYEGDKGLASYAIEDKEYKKWVAAKFQEDSPVINLLNKIVHLYLTNKNKFDELVSIVGQNGLKLVDEIQVISVSPNPGGAHADDAAVGTGQMRFHVVAFNLKNTERTHFQFNELSFGTKRIIALLVSLLFDSSSVALIEQPEDGIHTGLVHKLASILQSYADDAQFIVASHSITMLNRTPPEAVRLVGMANGFTHARALSPEEVSIAKDFMEQEGTFFEFLQAVQEA